MAQLPCMKDGNGLWTVIVNNQSFQFDPSHPEYMGLIECAKVGDAQEFLRLMETGSYSMMASRCVKSSLSAYCK